MADLRLSMLTMSVHQGPVTSATFSTNGEFFASGGTDEQVRVLHLSHVGGVFGDALSARSLKRCLVINSS